MSYDINCPYCNAELNINHDEGQGYDEDVLHEQECDACEKTFTFTTSVSYYYEPRRANCLNGSPHVWRPTVTFPREYTKLACRDCDATRDPNMGELDLILFMSTEERHAAAFNDEPWPPANQPPAPDEPREKSNNSNDR